MLNRKPACWIGPVSVINSTFARLTIPWLRSIIQGRGSYEDRTEMLRLIVDLVEASIFADNPDWRLGLLN